MTEYELHDLAAAAMGNFLTSFTVFISIVTAYVVAAFTAGRKLSGYQVTVVNVCFLLASGTMGALSYSIFQNFLLRARTAEAINASGAVPSIDFSWMVGMLYVFLVAACVTFMWHTRRSAANE